MFAPRWAKAAVVYFVIGVGFGLYMSLSRNHQFPGLHAHMNLLGWASMALIASFHRSFPALEEHRLAAANFWLYQIAFPAMMIGLFLSGIGQSEIAGPLVGLGGLLTGVAVLLFALSVFGSLSSQPMRRNIATSRGRTR